MPYAHNKTNFTLPTNKVDGNATAVAASIFALSVVESKDLVHAASARVQRLIKALLGDQTKLLFSVPASSNINLLLQLLAVGRKRRANNGAQVASVASLVLGGSPEFNSHTTFLRVLYATKKTLGGIFFLPSYFSQKRSSTTYTFFGYKTTADKYAV